MNNESILLVKAIGLFILTVTVAYIVLRLSKRPVNWVSLIGLGMCLGTPVITTSKINDINIINGLEKGGYTVSRKITNKKEDFYVGRNGSRSPRYLLCYEDRGEKCADVDWGNYTFKQIGDEMTFTFVSSSTAPQHSSSPTNEPGFDKFLLVVEILGAIIFLLKIIFPNFLNFERFNKNENISILER